MRGEMPKVWEQGLKNNFLSSKFLSPRLQGGYSTAQFQDVTANSLLFQSHDFPGGDGSIYFVQKQLSMKILLGSCTKVEIKQQTQESNACYL